MKRNYLLMSMLAVAAAFNSCSNDEVVAEGTAPDAGPTGKARAYIAVNINPESKASKAAVYEDGTQQESKVGTTRFYFFNRTGGAYIVDENTGASYVDMNLTYNNQAPDDDNVTEQSVPTIVIDAANDKPTSILAVLNPPVSLTNKGNLSITELQGLTDVACNNTTDFVMTNSTYFNGTRVVDAVTLRANQIQTSETAALANPVDLYVERVLAKVRTSFEEKYDTGEETGQDMGSKKIYAKVMGWNVTNANSSTYFVKHIDQTWTDNGLGIEGWNAPALFRSFWCQSYGNSEQYNFSWNGTNVKAQPVYCYENTYRVSENKKTAVQVACQLVDEDDKPIDLAIWKGTRLTPERMKTAMVRELAMSATPIWYKDEANSTAEQTVWKQLDESLIEYALSTTIGYQVNPKLTLDAQKLTFAKDGQGTAMTVQEANQILAKYKGLIYKDGMTYYFTDIKHLGSKGSVGEFGIVRNHVYDINISAIQGLGTPVFDPDQTIMPVHPTEEKAYVAARINVLSWRVVSQDITLQ